MKTVRSFAQFCLWPAVLAGLGCVTAAEPAVVEATPAERVAVLGPMDEVEVRVFGEPELSGSHQVSLEGALRLPLIGDVVVDGKAPEAVQREIEAAYNERYLKNAQVNVLVKKYNSRRVYVLGQVKNPGNYDFEERMTVIAAIARAGGVTRLADANRTLLTRGRGDEQKRMAVDVGDIQRGQAPDVEIIPGDIIFVPEALF